MTVLFVIVVGVVALAHMAPFPFVFEAFRPQRSVWRMPKSAAAPAIYLTFDDGPNAEWTPPLLDALRDHGAQATFFLIDHHITDVTAPIVRRMADEGHVIALHSGARWLMLESPAGVAATLQRAADRIAGITSRPPCRLFRPHAGWRSDTMYRALEQNGYRLAGWTWGMWDFDWGRARTADRLADRLARKASDGDIIVIHDGHHRDAHADRRHAAETVRRLAPAMQARGFVFKGMCQ